MSILKDEFVVMTIANGAGNVAGAMLAEAMGKRHLITPLAAGAGVLAVVLTKWYYESKQKA